MIQSDSLLLTSDVAKVFAVSSETVRQWERKGHLVALRTLGGTRLFSGDTVIRFQQERARGTGASRYSDRSHAVTPEAL